MIELKNLQHLSKANQKAFLNDFIGGNQKQIAALQIKVNNNSRDPAAGPLNDAILEVNALQNLLKQV